MVAKAAEEAKPETEDKKKSFEDAKNLFTKAKQAYAEAEVRHYSMMHAESVDPDDLMKSRESVDDCYGKLSEAKKAMVLAEANTYNEENPGHGNEPPKKDDAMPEVKPKETAVASEADAEAAKAAKAKADAEAEATAKGVADAEAAKAAKAKADEEDEESDEEKKKEAEAKAKADAEANKPLATATAKLEELSKAVASITETLKTLSEKVIGKPAVGGGTATATEELLKPSIATGAPKGGAFSKEIMAKATISYDSRTGAKVVVLGKEPNGGENLASASEDFKTRLSGIFRRNRP